MLEPTDEMRSSMARILKARTPRAGIAGSEIEEALTDVLALVERDNQVHPLCTATLGTDMRCEFEAGMAHPDEHSAKAPSGSRVRWS